MSLLIVAATSAELEPFTKTLQFQKEKFPGLNSYLFNNISIDILTSGIGMVATTYRLTKALNTSTYNFVLNAGIAGSFYSSINIGDIVQVYREVFSELGAEDGDKFMDLTEMGLMEKDELPYRNGYLFNESLTGSATLKALPKATGITVNKVHGNIDSINNVIRRFNPDIETMEGAAVFYVCLIEKIPFAQIRAISNKVELRNRDNWNIPLAITNLNQTLYKIVLEKSELFK